MKNVEMRTSRTHGLGLFALRGFAKEEIILDMDDSKVVADTSVLTEDDWAYNTDFLEKGKVVWQRGPERSINHSCDPNSYSKTIQGVRRVVAMRRITKGEEITADYAINGYNDGTFKCNCGSENCRKVYQGNFFKLPSETQIRYLPYLEGWFKSEHPLEIESLRSSRRLH